MEVMEGEIIRLDWDIDMLVCSYRGRMDMFILNVISEDRFSRGWILPALYLIRNGSAVLSIVYIVLNPLRWNRPWITRWRSWGREECGSDKGYFVDKSEGGSLVAV